ncbi:MAG TPA: adenylate/guanylate cyclase domain-containing protein, partial [Nitrospirota bacterium]|nr:adenylate/guanylate cyclase domain-containing protein [Nitrospirota bacterium]
ALIDATAASGNTYHSMIVKWDSPDDERKYNEQLNLPLPTNFISRYAVKKVSGQPVITPGKANNDFALPIEGLHAASRGVAVVEFTPDSDNVLRRTRPLREYQGRLFPVLGLAPFIDENSTVVLKEDRIEINDRTLPVDRNGNYIINMYAIDRVEPYSVAAVLSSLNKIKQGELEDLIVQPEEFKDAIVFVGASAVGAYDLKATPLAPSNPGVILHISLAGNYLENDFLHPPAAWLTVLSIVIGSFLTAMVVLLSTRFSIRAVFPPLLLISYVAFAFYSFKFNSLVEAVPFVFSTIGSAFFSFGYLTFTEGAEKRRVSKLFTQYVSKDVLDEVLHNYKEYLKSSAGQRVEITVLFSDIRGFTTLSETTPPEKIVEMLNVHFTHMADIILKHNGTIDKYIGDAIMAFWGAPVQTQDHAEKAVLASMEMAEALKDVNRELQERGLNMEVKIGIGLNTGTATIGNIGSEKKKNYTVVGDTVNLASRLESITKEYKSMIVLSEYTYEKIKDKFDCTILGNVKVKGREQPVTIYQPVARY